MQRFLVWLLYREYELVLNHVALTPMGVQKRTVMRKIVTNRIFAVIILITFAFFTIIISDYVAKIYEERNESIPSSVSILLLIIFVCGLCPVCKIFTNSFSKEKDSGDNGSY